MGPSDLQILQHCPAFLKLKDPAAMFVLSTIPELTTIMSRDDYIEEEEFERVLLL